MPMASMLIRSTSSPAGLSANLEYALESGPVTQDSHDRHPDRGEPQDYARDEDNIALHPSQQAAFGLETQGLRPGADVRNENGPGSRGERDPDHENLVVHRVVSERGAEDQQL